MMVIDQDAGVDEKTARRALSVFRQDFYRCLTKRADAMFELCDAV